MAVELRRRYPFWPQGTPTARAWPGEYWPLRVVAAEQAGAPRAGSLGSRGAAEVAVTAMSGRAVAGAPRAGVVGRASSPGAPRTGSYGPAALVMAARVGGDGRAVAGAAGTGASGRAVAGAAGTGASGRAVAGAVRVVMGY